MHMSRTAPTAIRQGTSGNRAVGAGGTAEQLRLRGALTRVAGREAGASCRDRHLHHRPCLGFHRLGGQHHRIRAVQLSGSQRKGRGSVRKGLLEALHDISHALPLPRRPLQSFWCNGPLESLGMRNSDASPGTEPRSSCSGRCQPRTAGRYWTTRRSRQRSGDSRVSRPS